MQFSAARVAAVTPGTIPTSCDVVIIGAGPAGLAAGILAAELGLDVVLLDEQSEPGGQIYRGITTAGASARAILGDDFARGEALIRAFRRSGARYLPSATVWSVTREAGRHELGVALRGLAWTLIASQVILATGALERPFPSPGWTLPGVMSAGAAQILLKTAALVPSGRLVLAGCGPLLYLVAWQLLKVGVEIAVLLDTVRAARYLRALPYLWGFLHSPYYAQGAEMLQKVRQQVPVVRGVVALSALGSARLAAVRYTANGKTATVPAEVLLLHQGIVRIST